MNIYKYFPYLLVAIIIAWVFVSGLIVTSWHPELQGEMIPPKSVQQEVVLELFGLCSIPILILIGAYYLYSKKGSPVTTEVTNNGKTET